MKLGGTKIIVCRWLVKWWNQMSSNLPTSKAGDAIGDNSTLMNRTPSDGRTALGDVISQDTCARTLKVIIARDQGKSKIIMTSFVLCEISFHG